MKHFDYTEFSENNCFLLKHEKNQSLNDYVVSVDIDENKIIINYHSLENKVFESETKLILEEYNKFGILVKTTIYDELTCEQSNINNISIYTFKKLEEIKE